MDFLLDINGEEIDCCRDSNRQLSLQCMMHHLVVIEPQCEAVSLVHLIHCKSSSATVNKRAVNPGT